MGRGAAAALVMVALGYIPYHVYSRSGLARTLELRRDLVALRARNAQLASENERLAREAEGLRSDPAALERVARNELGWVLPGEIVVDLGPAASSGPPSVFPPAPGQPSAGRPGRLVR